MSVEQAAWTVPLPLNEIEARLRDVTVWSRFLVGVEAVTQIGHERYLFGFRDGREIPVVARFHPHRHLFTWRVLAGPAFDGSLLLQEIDPSCTALTLRLREWPTDLISAFLEMMVGATGHAAADLQLLDAYLHEPRLAAS